jgi:hypothetical protein
MPIRFLCPSCDNPIEIDHQWASQKVACPFCHSTVTAPAHSTYTVPEFVPGAPAAERGIHAAPHDYATAPTGRNKLAIAALVLSIAWLTTYAAVALYCAPHLMEIMGPDATPEDLQRYLEEQVTGGDLPPWLVVLLLGMILCALFWIAGLLCAILALQRPGHRVLVYVSLGALSLGPLLMCAGGAMAG